MAILKKIKSATLIESLVATVLIVVVFIVASLILNNLLFNTFSRNTHAVEQRMFELEYRFNNKQLQLPYQEEFQNWDITIKRTQLENKTWVHSIAINRSNQKR